MPMIFKSSLWALAIIALALLAAIDVLPTEIAVHSNWLIPALAVSVLVLPTCNNRCAKG